MEPPVDIYTTPGLLPPEGHEIFESNPYTLRPHAIATGAICLTFSVLAVTARTFTKAVVLKQIEVEDWALLFAIAGLAAFTGVMLIAFDYGCGKHNWNVSIADTMKVVYYANIVQILYSPPMFAAKLAVLLQIKRIFTAHQKNFTYFAVWFLIAANLAVYTAILFAFIFACYPREHIWNPFAEGKARCINTAATMISSSAINLISDFTILILPLLGISRLQMPLSRKIGVAAIFTTGAFACAACIARLVFTIKLTQSKDITYALAPAGMWALAEFATVILCACFPTFPRLLKFLRGKPITEIYSYGSSGPSSKPTGKGSKAKSPGPYAWADSKVGTTIRSYIPLEESSIGLATSSNTNGERTSNGSGSSVALAPPGKISRTIEIETVNRPRTPRPTP
ncbi:hypothetical protein EJ04DRAFT_576987 [Polyplosphaeria fusca]|uniref:Rhodopsin domain-containing protein n=1 Tax=Polyplosphaeria fusca TaxID=682080 RepID=A0A9P4R026_9PLEO|nr:hypothetical protein EJ04DRAFT_576987 [Polyplosphaeria fusca]